MIAKNILHSSMMLVSLFAYSGTVNGQGYGSFVDQPRVTVAAKTRTPSVQIKSNLPVPILKTLAKLASTSTRQLSRSSTLDAFQVELVQLGIPTYLDLRSLEDEGVSPNKDRVKMPKFDTTLALGLEKALARLHCNWYVAKHGQLVIASQSAAEEALLNVVYDVTEMVSNGEIDPLINAIYSSVAPESWDQVGGPGSMVPYPLGGRDLLVVSAALPVHQGIQRLMQGLRTLSQPRLPQSALAVAHLPVPTSHRFARPAASRTSSVIAAPALGTKRGMRIPNRSGGATTSSYGGMMGGLGGGMF